MSVVYRLTQDNRKQSKTKGKWYARSLHTGVIDIDGLASIMQANCTLKKSDILAVIAELDTCGDCRVGGRDESAVAKLSKGDLGRSWKL